MSATNFIFMTSLLIFLSYAAAEQNESILSSIAPPPPAKSDGLSLDRRLKVNPEMAIVIVCLITAFFIMGCVSVYIRQCAEVRLLNDLPDDFEGSRRRSRRPIVCGLDPEIIDSFPMFLYSDVKGLKLGKEALECAVCLNEFEENETLRLLPKCCHVFHPDCIDAWLSSRITCPVCRANLLPNDGELGGHMDSLSHNLVSESCDSVPAQEISTSAPETSNVVIDIHIGSPDVTNSAQTTNKNCPPRSIPRRPRIDGKFGRSHSMGHLLVQPGEDCERFTLRLPEEVQSQLMKSELSRAKSCVPFPRVRSSRKGYRSNSGDIGRGKSNSLDYERFGREARSDRWGRAVMNAPFFSRAGSTQSPKEAVNREETMFAPKHLLRSVKSPFDHLFGGTEKITMAKGHSVD